VAIAGRHGLGEQGIVMMMVDLAELPARAL